MIIVPRRSASATRPLFARTSQKRGRVASAFVLHNVQTGNPFPTPPPARAGRPRPSRMGARDGPADGSLPPPRSRGGLEYQENPHPPYPNPHPLPPLATLAAPLPLPAGGLKLLQAIPFHTFIVYPPRPAARPTFLPFRSLPSAPCLATASAWGGRTLKKRSSGYAQPRKQL